VHCPQCRGNDLERRLHLGTIGLPAEELRRRDDAAERLANVTVACRKRVRAAIDERLRRLIAHEMARELRRDEARCCRRACDEIQNFFSLLLSAAGWELVSENRLLTGVMNRRVEEELARLAIERPSC